MVLSVILGLYGRSRTANPDYRSSLIGTKGSLTHHVAKRVQEFKTPHTLVRAVWRTSVDQLASPRCVPGYCGRPPRAARSSRSRTATLRASRAVFTIHLAKAASSAFAEATIEEVRRNAHRHFVMAANTELNDFEVVHPDFSVRHSDHLRAFFRHLQKKLPPYWLLGARCHPRVFGSRTLLCTSRTRERSARPRRPAAQFRRVSF
jgi:hypothetical protein